MQPQLAFDADAQPEANPGNHAAEDVFDHDLERSFMDELPPPPNTGFEGEGLERGASGIGTSARRAGDDLPTGADADLLLLAIQKREQRVFVLKFATLLSGFGLAAYLVGSGNGAILQGMIHLAVGAALGGAAVLAWQRRTQAG